MVLAVELADKVPIGGVSSIHRHRNHNENVKASSKVPSKVTCPNEVDAILRCLVKQHVEARNKPTYLLLKPKTLITNFTESSMY